ncbi:DUF4202 domain-containing protein [Olivibacter sp. SDN3]|uniref:DUF4202 domain-containing protein n=1 Tax=Olivibacter sp. SDN3 TaxID=2764720 RepID=UPI00165107D6|nr:DUF4202 domain-containing protein [Olivibacter sp. SDN3]QNL49013.1 DUF4202 domain-containing protein [Olivibacter sp. SDN3]
MEKLVKAFQLFDDYNRKDPTIFIWNGQSYPQEYFLALKLYDWVLRLSPHASETLLLASRSQHIGRWEIPRETYPEGREGYLRWRKELAAYHANKSAEILAEVGYEKPEIERVKEIILKKKIKVNSEVQIIENALCLVFLEYQYEDFYPKHTDKIVQILKKSLLKMDGEGHRFALSLAYSEQGKGYVSQALALLDK